MKAASESLLRSKASNGLTGGFVVSADVLCGAAALDVVEVTTVVGAGGGGTTGGGGDDTGGAAVLGGGITGG